MPWWVSHGNGSWFCFVRDCEDSRERGGATGSVSDRIVRLSWRDKISTRELTPPKKNRGGLQGGENGDSHDWCSATNRCITRDRRCPRAIRCHFGRCCVGNQHKRVGRRPDSDEAVGQVRASRTRVGGFQGCSLTLSWLQRLARDIFSHPGHSLLRRKSRRR